MEGCNQICEFGKLSQGCDIETWSLIANWAGKSWEIEQGQEISFLAGNWASEQILRRGTWCFLGFGTGAQWAEGELPTGEENHTRWGLGKGLFAPYFTWLLPPLLFYHPPFIPWLHFTDFPSSFTFSVPPHLPIFQMLVSFTSNWKCYADTIEKHRKILQGQWDKYSFNDSICRF